MRKKVIDDVSSTSQRMCPALDPEARENQLIHYAIDLAEKQMLAGTASSQVITHYLKLGTMREKKEIEILECQKTLIEAKTRSLTSTKEIEELYTNAIKAFQSYSPRGGEPGDY